MKLFFTGLLLAAVVIAAETDHPTGNRTTPPTLESVSPAGVARGTTVEITVEGLNLARSSAIYFSEPGLKGRILRVKELPDTADVRLGSNGTLSTVDLGPLPPRNQVTVEVDVSPEAGIGPVAFRLQTPLGTSPEGKLLVEPYYGESPDREPNDTVEDAVETFLPAILTGAISKPGDVDFFKIKVRAGEQLTFENGAAQIGSTLQPVISIIDAGQNVIREYGRDGGMNAVRFVHKFEKAGTYYVRVSDYLESGRRSNFYRIKVGRFPLVAWTYPLGLQRGQTRDVQLYGFNLGDSRVKVSGAPSPEYEDMLRIRPKTSAGRAFNEVKLALGREPEVESAGTNGTPDKAQPIEVNTTVNGRIDAPAKGVPVANYFRFHARKGQRIVAETNARRLGSPLDTFVEILDARANPIERAAVRSVLETSTTLSERDSATPGIRLTSWNGFTVGDYVMVGGEILRVQILPETPDNDAIFDSFGGQRLSFFDTTTEAHAVDKAVYKVQIHPPGTKFTPNGLPVVHLFYQNDDGGPGYGKDSLVHFTAPADGDYLVRLRDVGGLGGPEYAYRLTLRERRPDFRLSVNQRNPNVPAGGSIPITVTALRIDEFDGPIDVSIEDLPAGLKASKGVIAPGQFSTTLLLSADQGAQLASAAPLKVTGKAATGSETTLRAANADDRLKLISIVPQGDIRMTAQTREVTLEPGGSAEVVVEIDRQNGFRGRVPVAVMNLPPRVRVNNSGLNGVLITEEQTKRSFILGALPNAAPIEQWIYVGGAIETRSTQPSVLAAPQAILLKIKPKQVQISQR